VSGLTTDEDQSRGATDEGVPVGAADAEADRKQAAGEEGSGSDDSAFVNADTTDSETDQGVPVGRADAEQDRLRASSDEEE
jgi:hypothetical protein